MHVRGINPDITKGSKVKVNKAKTTKATTTKAITKVAKFIVKNWGVMIGSKGCALVPLCGRNILFDEDGKPCGKQRWELPLGSSETTIPWSGKDGAFGRAARTWVGRRGEACQWHSSLQAALKAGKIKQCAYNGRTVFAPAGSVKDGTLVKVPQYVGCTDIETRGRVESRAVYNSAGTRRNAGQTWRDLALAKKA